MDIDSEIQYDEALKRIKGLKEKTFNNVRTQWRKDNGTNHGNNGKTTKSTPSKKDQAHEKSSMVLNEFIDDPDELLLSVAIRELNRPNPDSRWASILIQCKKEKISTKGDVIDKFKQLPTQALVNILSKSLQKEPS